METQTTKEINISRIFDAPRDLVWKAWTEEKHVQQWFCPKGFTIPVIDWDAKPGNKIFVQMKGPDGNLYPMSGEFVEIRPQDKFVFIGSALDGNGNPLFKQLSTAIFETDGNKTKLSLRLQYSDVRPEAAPHLGGANEGWNMSLDKLNELVKAM